MNVSAESSSPFPDDFYGFPDVPFHIHLGMRFERPAADGPAVVHLPAAPDLLNRDGTHSPAAVYTVGEVASGISVCDALALYGGGEDLSLVPLVLTRRTEFDSAAPVRGDLRSRSRFAGDADAATERLRSGRKANVEVACEVHGDGDVLAGSLRVYFYVRMMSLDRLESIAGEMVPGMAQRARQVLGAARAGA